MKMLHAVLLVAAGASSGWVAGCAGDFTHDPSRPRPMRAVTSPVERNSESGELSSEATTGVPLVSVELPNGKKDHATVHTILNPPASEGSHPTAVIPPPNIPSNPAPSMTAPQPDAGGPATAPTQRKPDPLLGPRD